MMSVNAISSAMAATIYIQKTSRLSDEIIDKLIDLGINPNEVSSNYQATKIIQEAESSNASSSMSSVSTASASDKTGASNSVRDRAEKLADKVGVSYDENTLTEDLLEDIQDAIDAMFALSALQNDKSLYETVAGYQEELNKIILEYRNVISIKDGDNIKELQRSVFNKLCKLYYKVEMDIHNRGKKKMRRLIDIYNIKSM